MSMARLHKTSCLHSQYTIVYSRMASYITSKSVIAVGAVLPGLATVAVVLRLYSRMLKSVHTEIDDWLIVCSLVGNLQHGLRTLLIQCLLLQILIIGMGIMLIVGKFPLAHSLCSSDCRETAGSALHALAQPTPSGHGPKGFMTVLNYAIITTEQVRSKYCVPALQGTSTKGIPRSHSHSILFNPSRSAWPSSLFCSLQKDLSRYNLRPDVVDHDCYSHCLDSELFLRCAIPL